MDFNIDDILSWAQKNPGATGAIIGGIGSLIDPAQAQTNTVQQQVQLPDYIAPYVRRMLGGFESAAKEDYTPYTGQRIADFTGDQQAGFQGVRDIAGQGGISSFMQQAGNKVGNLPTLSVGEFDNAAAQKYMSPYMQNVTDIQKREALRDFQMQGLGLDAAAVKAGAFGGSRHGIVEAEAQRNLNQQLQDIQQRGSQSAFENAQGQFERDRSANFGAQVGNMQGALGAGQTLAGLGQNQFMNQLAGAQGLMSIGGVQQNQQQQGLNLGYQDFLNQLNYPKQQLQFMQSGIQGLPMTQYATASTTPAPTMAQQLISSGIGGYQIGNTFAPKP